MKITYIADFKPETIAANARRAYHRGDDALNNPYEFGSASAYKWLMAFIAEELEESCAAGEWFRLV